MDAGAGIGSLVAFLRARLDDRERTARAATPGPWCARGVPYEGFMPDDPCIVAADGRWVAGLAYDGLSTSIEHEVDADAEHIALNDPASVLLDVAADRELIAAYQRAVEGGSRGVYTEWEESRVWALELAVKIRAERFKQHPDYQESWKP